jgi:hypothetical protein
MVEEGEVSAWKLPSYITTSYVQSDSMLLPREFELAADFKESQEGITLAGKMCACDVWPP